MGTAHDNPAYEGDAAAGAAGGETGRPKAPAPHQLTEEDVKKEQRAMTKDICFLSLGFFLLFTSYQAMSNLQSSINENVGTNAMSVLYVSMVLSSAFVPTWLIKKLGVRMTIAVCMFSYTAYIAAQFYPTAYTLIPTAAILGLGASPLWSAKCTYLTHVGNQYSKLTGANSEVIITRFFGIFFLFFQSSQIMGNSISSIVLATDSTAVNSSDPRLATCGALYCQGADTNTSLSNDISNAERYTMSGIYLAFAVTSSVVVLLFVSPLTRYGEAERVGSSTGRSTKQQLVSTFRHMKNPYQLLVAPLTFWSGVEQAFIGADYTAAFVSCGLGVHMVGYTMICFGVCNATCSFFCSVVVKKVGRIPIFLSATVINAALIIVLLNWAPSPDMLPVFFVIPALWGVADAVWQTQINAFYGVLFPKDTEAAFSNYKLFESLGFILAYVCSGLICIAAKIYILIGCLLAGVSGYLVIEYLERRRTVRQLHSTTKS